jgi:chaperonin GroES
VNFRLLADRVLVSRDITPEQTTGGVILVSDAQKLPTTGIVRAAGPGSRALDGTRIDNAVRKGDHVYFSEYAGQDIEVDGKEYILLREQDILGVVE